MVSLSKTEADQDAMHSRKHPSYNTYTILSATGRVVTQEKGRLTGDLGKNTTWKHFRFDILGDKITPHLSKVRVR